MRKIKISDRFLDHVVAARINLDRLKVSMDYPAPRASDEDRKEAYEFLKYHFNVEGDDCGERSEA